VGQNRQGPEQQLLLVGFPGVGVHFAREMIAYSGKGEDNGKKQN
jgi:hypothetical protein